MSCGLARGVAYALVASTETADIVTNRDLPRSPTCAGQKRPSGVRPTPRHSTPFVVCVGGGLGCARLCSIDCRLLFLN